MLIMIYVLVVKMESAVNKTQTKRLDIYIYIYSQNDTISVKFPKLCKIYRLSNELCENTVKL
jgi:hypothetical protein